MHGVGGEAFTFKDGTDVDLLITDASGEAEAFNVFDMAVLSHDAVTARLALTPTPITLIWERGSNDGTYYSGDATVHLLGAASDDDGYDDTVILHEIGHFFEDTIGRSDSPGGGHDGSPTDPNLAWSEGFSTYWAMAIKDVPFYGDSNSGGGWGYNADTALTRAPQPAGDIGQDVGENLTTEVLWDLGDAASGDDDQLAGDHLRVLNVQPMYLRTAALRNVGEPGVDLVDFLDGFFVADGLAQDFPAWRAARAGLRDRPFQVDHRRQHRRHGGLLYGYRWSRWQRTHTLARPGRSGQGGRFRRRQGGSSGLCLTKRA